MRRDNEVRKLRNYVTDTELPLNNDQDEEMGQVVESNGAPSVYRYQTNRPFIMNGHGFWSRRMSYDTGPRLGEVWLLWLV